MKKVKILEITGGYEDYDERYILPTEWDEISDEDYIALQRYCTDHSNRHGRLVLIAEKPLPEPASIKKYVEMAKIEHKKAEDREKKRKEKEARRQATLEKKKREKELRILERLKEKYDGEIRLDFKQKTE